MQPTMSIDPSLIRARLRNLASPVTMHYYTSDVASWYSYAEQHLLEAVAQASPHVDLSVHAERWDAQREQQAGIARTPAIALYGEKDTGIRYYGMPDGYELDTFLSTLNAISSRVPNLRADTIARLDQLTQPLHLEVIVLPT
jgi:alkyl hydroperoxide reductase subunit AhpF